MKGTAAVSLAGFAGCTSLGYSLPETLAAMGAGLSNFTDTGLKNNYGTVVTAAALLEHGAPRFERLRVLADIALADVSALLAAVGVADAPLMLGLPGDLDDDEQRTLTEEVRRNRVVGSDVAWFPYGRASTFAALASAADLIRRGVHRFVVVGGIDSLCAPDTVQRLVDTDRVLGPHTEGTIPGEGAVFALLARGEDPAVDPAASMNLEALARHRASRPFSEMDRVSGDALARVFRTLREGGSPRVERVVAAHSGEGYFGHSFCHAYLREVDVMPEPLHVDLVADCAGDVGAAAGMLGLAFGMYLTATDPRGARGRVLVYSESDGGELGAAIIEGTPTSWARRVA